MKETVVRTFNEELALIKEAEGGFWSDYEETSYISASGMFEANINGFNGKSWIEGKICAGLIAAAKTVSKKQGAVEILDASDATYCTRVSTVDSNNKPVFDMTMFHGCQYRIEEPSSNHPKRVDCIIVNNLSGKKMHVEVKTQKALTNGYERIYKFATAGGQKILQKNFPKLKGSHFFFVGPGFEDGTNNRSEINEIMEGSKIGLTFCSNHREEKNLSQNISSMIQSLL